MTELQLFKGDRVSRIPKQNHLAKSLAYFPPVLFLIIITILLITIQYFFIFSFLLKIRTKIQINSSLKETFYAPFYNM